MAKEVSWVRAGLRTARLDMGLSTKELANKLGRSETLINQLELCRKNTSEENWNKLSVILRCDTEYLKAIHKINNTPLKPNENIPVVIKSGDVKLNKIGGNAYAISGIVYLND